jgi:phospholipid/cholesterol/gamma-HCH transport system permease protein
VDPPTATEARRVERYEGGVRLAGHLRTADAGSLVAEVRDATRGAQVLEVDLDHVDELDGGVIALLSADFAARGVRVAMRCGDDRFWPLLQLYEGGASPPSPRRRRTAESLLGQVGRVTIHDVSAARAALGFLGAMAVAIARVVRHPRRAHWSDVPPLVEAAGPNALPIVLVINFLLGFVVAYMGARALELFGANIFVAELVGITMTRQLGPLMTAIIVSGRSGATFATELGSMKVSEEIDALRTLGIEPFGRLVLPRLVALVIVSPVLTILADVVGVLGGLVVATTSLGLTSQEYMSEIREAVVPWDVEQGLIMSVAYAIAIGLIACQQGFAASGGPEGVGRRTTASVVASLFAVVLLDACLTVLFRMLGPT